MNWIKTHGRATALIIGGILVASGLLMLFPWSASNLIVVGALICFVVLISYFPQ